MKRLVLSFFLSVALLATSCNEKQSTKNPISNPSDVEGSYSGTASVKVSGAAYELSSTEAIEIKGQDLSAMTITVPEKVVPGEGVLTFTKVAFSKEDGSFAGKLSNNDRDLAISGHIANKQLMVSITPSYKSALVGAYNFEAPKMVKNENDSYEDSSQVMICKVETPTGKVMLFGEEQDQEFMDTFFNGIIGQMMLRSYMEVKDTVYKEDKQTIDTILIDTVYNGALRNVTFHADGNLTAQYNKNFSPSFMGLGGEPKLPEFIESPMSAMRWYVKGDKLFLVPNMNMMTKGISRDGLPINFVMQDGKITIFADKTQVAPLLALLNPVIQSLPDQILGGALAPIAKMMVGEFTVMAQEATRFDLGVCFEKGDLMK